MNELHVIVIATMTNILLPPWWKVGTPVERIHRNFGGDSFDATRDGKIDAYATKEEAEAEITARQSKFAGVTFEVVTYTRK